MSDEWLVLVESNTTGSGRLFCAAARRMGLRPVLLSRDASRYPYVETDSISTRPVDTTDIGAVIDACAGLGGSIAGVTSSSEYSIAIAAEAARAFDRPHPDPDAIRACRDKHSQRRALAAAGLPGPKFAAATTPGEAVDAARAIGLPVVVKPSMGSGSVATRLCADANQVRATASAVLDVDPATLGLPPQSAVMVEEYLTGAEFSVETLDLDVVGVTGKHLGPEPYFLEIGHDFPARVPAADAAVIGQAAIIALRALGLGWGPAHVELRLGPAGARIVEVNPRLAGGMIPRMVEQATGIDMVFHAVARAAGRAQPPAATRHRSASIRFLVAPHGGRFTGLRGVDEARAVPHVVDVEPIRPPGTEVALRHSFTDRLGYVIAAAPSGDAAAAAAELGLRFLHADMDATNVAVEVSST